MPEPTGCLNPHTKVTGNTTMLIPGVAEWTKLHTLVSAIKNTGSDAFCTKHTDLFAKASAKQQEMMGVLAEAFALLVKSQLDREAICSLLSFDSTSALVPQSLLSVGLSVCRSACLPVCLSDVFHICLICLRGIRLRLRLRLPLRLSLSLSLSLALLVHLPLPMERCPAALAGPPLAECVLCAGRAHERARARTNRRGSRGRRRKEEEDAAAAAGLFPPCAPGYRYSEAFRLLARPCASSC